MYDNYHTSLRTKEVVEIPSIYDQLPKVTHIDPDYKMNYDQILDKPFLVTTIDWSTATNNFKELWRLPFPSSIMSNPLAAVPFESSAFYQARMCCMLQVSGTPMHQGLILVAAVPHGTPKIVNANQILSSPHVFLNATESTSVCLECPMYTPSTVYRTQNPDAGSSNLSMRTNVFGSDVFDLVFFVMDALTVAVGSSTSISISVHNIFKEAQFFVPKVGKMKWQTQCGVEKLWAFKSKANISTNCACGGRKMSEHQDSLAFKPEGFITNLWRLPTRILDDVSSGLKVVTGDLIDYGRGMIKELTGFHNPNIPKIEDRVLTTFRNFPNNVDQPVHLEVLDNHAQFSRIYDDYYFRTKQDEMDLKFLTSKPVFVGKFSVAASTSTGKNLFAYPMTPMVEGAINDAYNNKVFYSPMRTIYEASRFWRGDLKMHIQAVCTNFHFCKIIVLKNYAMTDGPLGVLDARVPAYNNIHNLNTDTLEFSAGGQIQTIDLKFNSNLRQLECTKDYVFNAINHGIVYGYLVQPLTHNSNVPTSVTFNVYISGGDDLEFSGYALDPIDITPGTEPSYPGVPNFFNKEVGNYEITKDGGHTGRILPSAELRKVKLEERKIQFFKDKPSVYEVQDGDTWDDISYITGNPVETLRNLNSETHNTGSIFYSMSKGPHLFEKDELNFTPCWRKRSVEPSSDCFKPETMEHAEGTNALVTPNDQDEILNNIVPCTENIKMSFRPNTSVRDYMRFMYPQKTIEELPTQIKNVVAIDIFDLLRSEKGTYFQAFYSLFTGMSGGFKFKFKISGVSNASAVFVPPSSHCLTGSYPRIYNMYNKVPTQTDSRDDFLSGTTYNPTDRSFTAPQIEMQDYTRPYSGTGDSVKNRPGSSFVLEMAVPNMNPYNFSGNAVKWYSKENYATSNYGPENDLGVIYINYDASYDGSNYGVARIIPFIGINDETRLGFQVYAPEKTLPTYTDVDTDTVCRSSILHPNPIPGFAGGIPLEPIPVYSSAYYFNT